MLFSIVMTAISILVAVVGMKCTTCLAEDKQQKNKVALIGGILFIIAGQLTHGFQFVCLFFNTSKVVFIISNVSSVFVKMFMNVFIRTLCSCCNQHVWTQDSQGLLQSIHSNEFQV